MKTMKLIAILTILGGQIHAGEIYIHNKTPWDLNLGWAPSGAGAYILAGTIKPVPIAQGATEFYLKGSTSVNLTCQNRTLPGFISSGDPRFIRAGVKYTVTPGQCFFEQTTAYGFNYVTIRQSLNIAE